ncbi:hypothetical protein AU476_25530 [Cupriavidus sp. UYMSc13B]|nr:hypothetical protein AU476_25530 [Cupriavidus sp. UYMSc13B]
MRSQTTCFSSSLKNTQLLTSEAVRPQPWQISSNSVEQMPMQGLSGRRTAWNPWCRGPVQGGAGRILRATAW